MLLLFCICVCLFVLLNVVLVLVRWRTRINMVLNLVNRIVTFERQLRAHSGRPIAALRDRDTIVAQRLPVSGATSATPSHHYDVVAMVLTPSEQQFARVLADALPSGYTVMMQVALQRVVAVRNPRRGQPWRDKRWNQISQKSLDFVVIRSADSKIILAIELDDATHLQANRIARDELLDTIMADAGVWLLHVPVHAHYDCHALQMQLLGYLAQ